MSEQTIQSLRARPRFRKLLKADDHSVIEGFKQLGDTQSKVMVSVATHHIYLRVPKSEEHFWSPRLNLVIEKHEKGTLVRGLFGPKASIWTAFVFFYAAFGVATLAMLFWGLSQNTLDMYPWALWFVPGGLLTIGGIYLLTQFGQKLGFPQMLILNEHFTSVINKYEELDYEDAVE